jgi:hypothetical protein
MNVGQFHQFIEDCHGLIIRLGLMMVEHIIQQN